MGTFSVTRGASEEVVSLPPGAHFTAPRFDMMSPQQGDYDGNAFERLSGDDWFIMGGDSLITFRDCRFLGLRIGRWHCSGVRFENCVFEDCRFKDWRLIRGDIAGCRFSGWSDATLWFGNSSPDATVPLSVNHVKDNDFTRFHFRGNLGERLGIDLMSNQFMLGPEGFLTDDRTAVASRAKKIICDEWPPTKERGRALRTLEVVLEDALNGQRHWYQSRRPRSPYPWEDFLTVLQRAQQEVA